MANSTTKSVYCYHSGTGWVKEGSIYKRESNAWTDGVDLYKRDNNSWTAAN